MSSQITDITIEDFANTNVISSNTSNSDNIASRYNQNISLGSSVLPSIDATIEFGDASNRFKSIHSNDFTANTFRPEDSHTITFFGNLYPSLDNQFDVGIPTQRWRRINVKDIDVSGNSILTGPTILIDANTFIQDDVDPTKQFQFQADTITTGTIREFSVPDADTTLVGTDVSQTLTNKDITGTTNTVRATQLGTTGSDVIIVGASPPTANSVLTALSATTAEWVIPNFSSSITLKNDGTNVSGTPHSALNFIENEGITIVASNFELGTANVNVTIPTTTKGDLLVRNSTTNTRLGVGIDDYLLIANSVTGEGMNWAPPQFKDSLFKVVDSVDPTKAIEFDAAGTTGTSTTFTSSQTTDRTITIPDATTTIVGTDVTQTLTNKDITGTTNTVRATQLGTTGSDVIINTASPPTANSVLTAITATTAEWSVPTFSSSIVLKNQGIDISGTPHSALNFITNEGITLVASNFSGGTANVNVTIPTTTKGDLLVRTTTTNTRLPIGTNDYLLIANSTPTEGMNWAPPQFKDSLFKIVDSVDPTKSIEFDAAGTTGTSTTFTSSQTTDRNITIPDATTTMVGTDVTQTLTNKSLVDANTFIVDDIDSTKKVQFQASSVTTGTTKTLTVPDANTTIVGTDVTQILTNKSLVDASTFIIDDVDTSKRFQFQASPITTATTRTFTVPNADTTLVGTDVTQTLTNKTITGTTNTVRATQLGTTGADVTVDASDPPLINQLLFATSPTNAEWANASTVLMGSAVTDNQFISASALDSTTSTTFVDIATMTLTSSVPGSPAPYLFLFNATCYTSNNSTSLDFSFALNGTALTGTVIRVTPETKERNVSVIFSTPTISDGDVITAQWRRSNSGGTGNITFRTMVIIGFGSQ